MARRGRAREEATRRLAGAFLERYPGEAAPSIDAASPDDAVALLQRHPAETVGELLRRVSPDRAAELLARLPAAHAGRVLRALDPHRAAPLLARLEPEARERCLELLPPESAQELRSLAEYPRDCAGALMNPRVTAFPPETEVRQVLRRLRELRRRRIQNIFVIDAEGRLTGSIPLQEAVLAPTGAALRSLARPVQGIAVTAPRDEVISELEQRRTGSLPVVDFDGRLLGVIRHDDVMEAAREAATAELVTMVGASREERALSPPLFAVRKRLGWLEVNLATAFLAASVVGLFEETIARFTALAVLLPVVAGQSGNTGAQALAVTMRGLALREVRTPHWLRVAAKELTVATVNGLAIAATTSLAVYVWSGSAGLAMVIGFSMVASMMAAGLAGALIPMGLTSLGQDPAQSSSIILTTVTDVAGFFSFLGIATLLSGLL